MSWRFLCCVLITCGYIHQQNSDEKYRKYFDCILFQFKSLLLFPFFFFSCIYLFLKYCIEFLWNQFLFFLLVWEVGFFMYLLRSCVCSCCHHLITGLKRLSWILDFFLNAICSFCCKPFSYSCGSVTELCKRRTYLRPKRMQFYCSLIFIFSSQKLVAHMTSKYILWVHQTAVEICLISHKNGY